MVDLRNPSRRAKLAVAGVIATAGLTAGAAGLAWAGSTPDPIETGWGTTVAADNGENCPRSADSGTAADQGADQGADL